MGLFGSIGGAIKGVYEAVKPTKEKFQNVGAVLNASFNPFSKTKVQANVSNPTLKKGLELVANHPYATAGVVAGGITAVANPSAALSVGKALIPTTTKGKIVGTAASLVGVGLVKSNPLKAAEVAVSTPSNLINFGSNVGGFLTDPSIENAKKIIKENPIISGVTAATILGSVGLGAAGIVSNIMNTRATKENTNAMETLGNLPQGDRDIRIFLEEPQSPSKPIPSGGNGVTPLAPITPETKSISAGRTKKARRSKKTPKIPNISQRVNVIVSNKSSSIGIKNSSKNYLKREVLAY